MLLPALVAVSGGLAALPAAGLELGELNVQSALGQPLRASIAFALAPNEQISSSCVSLQQGAPAGGLPAITSATMGIADGVISLTGKSPIREPMLTMRVNVNCAYTPSLSREYMLFIDPPGAATGQASDAAVAAPSAVTPAAATPAAVQPRRQQAPTTGRRPVVKRPPIADVSRYQVQRGDTVSEIAQRIENRPIGIWDAVALIFEANPAAFINNDPNKLKAGSWLDIPDFGNPQSVSVVTNELPAVQSIDNDAADSALEASPDVAAAVLFAEPAAIEEPMDIAAFPTTDEYTPAVDSQASDANFESDNPFVSSVGADGIETILLDTQLETPDLGSSPNGTTMSIQSPPAETSSSNWLWWLAGSGIGIIAALLLFGRRFRGRFGSAPIRAVALPAQEDRRIADNATAEVEVISDLDVGLNDDTPTEENLLLDADLIAGTGLGRGTDLDVAQDFGFAATTELDMVLPEEANYDESQEPTDRVFAQSTGGGTILDSEVLPGGDDYDMSVIVDATKIQNPQDATERDLKAITIETGVLETGVFEAKEHSLPSGNYTVTQEIDLDILAQDYEDEMTATQMVTDEISKVTSELVSHMDDEPLTLNEEEPLTETNVMPLASVTDLDVTAFLPATDEAASGVDETGLMDILAEQTAEFSIEEETVKMPANDEDVTVEMAAKSRK